MVEDAVPTTQHATLQPSVTTVADPTHTKEDDPSVLPTTLSVTNVELLAEVPVSQQTPAQSQQRKNVQTLEDEENYIFIISTTKETVLLYSVRGNTLRNPSSW